MSNQANEKQSLPQSLIDSIPPILWRTDPDFTRITGISRRRAANLDCQGEGPEERVVMGRNRVGYPRESVIKFLSSRMCIVPRKTNRK